MTYGANPTTEVNARSGEFLRTIEHLPPAAARAALAVLNQRSDIATATAPTGRGLSLLDLQLGL